MDTLFSYLIKNDFVRAQILAYIRHCVTAVGVGLIAHGWVDNGMVEAFSGFVTASVGFYMAQHDVRKVDTKIADARVMTQPLPASVPIPETTSLLKQSRQGKVGTLKS